MICPKCRKTELRYYNGNLGYESLTCEYCNLDIKSEEAITACNNYESEMRAEIANLKDKLSRRNMQIKSLKKHYIGNLTTNELLANARRYLENNGFKVVAK